MKRSKIQHIIQVILFFSYVWLAFCWNANLKTPEVDFRFCYFKNISDLPCPSCGTTRALTSLLHGEIWNSLMWNPLGLIIAFAIIIFQIVLIVDYLTKRRIFLQLYNRVEQIIRKPPVAITLSLLIIINWMWNIFKDV